MPRVGGSGGLDRVTPRRKKGPAKASKKNVNRRPPSRPTKPKKTTGRRGY